ncbi:MAG: N-acetyl-gamma-glutamyl-phosphate reductase [Nitrospinota bacterium]
MIKIGILGGSGYTGLELIRILLNHQHVKISTITSERYSGVKVSEAFPFVKDYLDVRYESLSPEEISKKCDFIFSALPHKASMAAIPHIIKTGKKVVDLSADYRLKSPEIYKEWYKEGHTSPELLSSAVYGLPEIKRVKIKTASLVANPGCYPTGAILALAPVIKRDIIDTDSIIIDSKSGVTGAGRRLDDALLFSECNENFKPYNIASHRHIPEMEQEISEIAQRNIRLTFAPHLLPINRGILTTIYSDLISDVIADDILKIYEDFYMGERFIRIAGAGKYPQIHHVMGSNHCDIGFQIDKRAQRIIIVSAIDNLVKGASGQAVQNMNIMLGFDEYEGLERAGIFP